MRFPEPSPKAIRLRAGIILFAAFSALVVAARAGTVTNISEFPLPIPASEPQTIIYGPDGAYWFVEFNTDRIGRVTTNGVLTEYILPPRSEPLGITAGPDNNLWFTEFNANSIGCMSANGVLLKQFPIPTGTSHPAGITVGPDNRIWFAESATSKFGVLAANTNSANSVTEYNPVNNTNALVYFLTSGPDGNIWFAEPGVGKIGRMSTNGTNLGEFAGGTNTLGPNSQPFHIITGPDGALWFSEVNSNRIGRITTNAVPTITESSPLTNSLPMTNLFGTIITNVQPNGLMVGRDGNIWFAEFAANQVGRLNPTNWAVAEFIVPSTNAGVSFIASGPDGNIWFTEFGTNNIGVLAPSPTLSIKSLAAAKVALSWPTNLNNGFTLQSNANLNTTNWVTVTNVPAVLNSQYTVTNSAVSNAFYRLIK
jgi:virginiamycin B lyase